MRPLLIFYLWILAPVMFFPVILFSAIRPGTDKSYKKDKVNEHRQHFRWHREPFYFIYVKKETSPKSEGQFF